MKCRREWRLLARTQLCNNSESHASQITNQARELHGPQGIQQSVHPSCSFRPVIGFNARADKPIATSLAMQLDANSDLLLHAVMSMNGNGPGAWRRDKNAYRQMREN